MFVKFIYLLNIEYIRFKIMLNVSGIRMNVGINRNFKGGGNGVVRFVFKK